MNKQRRYYLKNRDNSYSCRTTPNLMCLTIQNKQYFVMMYSITLLAQRLECSRILIHWALDNKWLPKPLWKDSNGSYLYTEHEVNIIEDAFLRARKTVSFQRVWNDGMFTRDVKEASKKLINGVDIKRTLIPDVLEKKPSNSAIVDILMTIEKV